MSMCNRAATCISLQSTVTKGRGEAIKDIEFSSYVYTSYMQGYNGMLALCADLLSPQRVHTVRHIYDYMWKWRRASIFHHVKCATRIT